MTQQSIMPFIYGEQEIRVVTDKQGNPWWVAKDICDVLGIVNPTQAVQQLDDDERAMKNIGHQRIRPLHPHSPFQQTSRKAFP